MDKKDVPQNIDNLHQGNYKTIVYAVDENGDYVKVKTSGWKPEDIAHELAWKIIEKRIEDTKKLVLNGELSSIAFFMEKTIMTPKRISGMLGFSLRKVKKHLKPKGFAELSEEQLGIYADLFEITVNELLHFKKDTI